MSPHTCVHVHVCIYVSLTQYVQLVLSYSGTQTAILVNTSYSNNEPCVAGLCTLHADCPPSSGSEDVNFLPHPSGQREDKPTASGRASGSKHTVEGDSCVEENNMGTLDITSHYVAGRKQTNANIPLRSVLKTLPSHYMIQHDCPT